MPECARASSSSRPTWASSGSVNVTHLEHGHAGDQAHPDPQLGQLLVLVAVGLDDGAAESLVQRHLGRGVLEALPQTLEHPVEVPPHHVVLGREVAKQRAAADAERIGDVIDRRLLEAAVAEQLECGPRHRPARGPGRAPRPLADAVRGGHAQDVIAASRASRADRSHGRGSDRSMNRAVKPRSRVASGRPDSVIRPARTPAAVASATSRAGIAGRPGRCPHGLNARTVARGVQRAWRRSLSTPPYG